jgi:hypothetical protein
MARSYSQSFLETLNTMDPNNLGVQLAKLCVKANLPTLYVARKIGVSRFTIHSWFRGQDIGRKINASRVEDFIEQLKEGFSEGNLPVATLKTAEEFLNRIKLK